MMMELKDDKNMNGNVDTAPPPPTLHKDQTSDRVAATWFGTTRREAAIAPDLDEDLHGRLDDLFSFKAKTKTPASLEFLSPSQERSGDTCSRGPTLLPEPSNSFLNSSSLRLVVLGASGSGKTALVTSFMNDNLDDFGIEANSPTPTIGVDFKSRSMYLSDGGAIRVQMWDTAGSKRFASFIPYYIRLSKAAVVVYDVSSLSSFTAVREHVVLAQAEGSAEIGIVIVGTKIDKEDRCITNDEGRNLAVELGVGFIEVSAKTGVNVKEVFRMLIHAPQIQQPTASPPTLHSLSLGHYKDKEENRGGMCELITNLFSSILRFSRTLSFKEPTPVLVMNV